jgi:hypothetical protein
MKKKRSERRMWVAIGSVLVVLGLILIYFHIPYSPTRSEFKALQQVWSGDHTAGGAALFTEADLTGLPVPVQRYFRHTGFIGKPKMIYMHGRFAEVTFSMGKDKPNMDIGYSQYNRVKEPDRFALIEASKMGIPFQGLDRLVEGKGSMKGIIAKAFPLFDQKGREMDQACLVTALSESLIVPAAALQDYIRWEGVDDLQARATITYKGITASGLFTFDDDGKMLSFTTNDRSVTEDDGSFTPLPWTALMGDYRERNGLLLPTSLKAVWHYPDGDRVYFDSRNATFDYGY